MINFNRILAMILRYLYLTRHSLDRITDMFYWPLMDLFLWGLTGLYFARLNLRNPHAVEIVLTGVIFWLITWRAQYEINVNLLSELWDRNLVNIFASPLKIEEFALSFLIFGFLKTAISLAFMAFMSYLLYHFNVFVYGFFIIPAVISLLLTGWAVGFFVSGFIIRYGVKIQAIAWAGVALLTPVSALYYPLSILPEPIQKIAAFIPSSYVFESLRELLLAGQINYGKIAISFLLNLIYLILSITFFIFMFHRSRKLGLGRLI